MAQGLRLYIESGRVLNAVTDVERPLIVPGEQEAFRLSRSPSHLIRRAQQYISEKFVDGDLSDKVTLRQTEVLAAVAENQPCSQSVLVSATGVDRSTMAEMIGRMEKRGLIKRVDSEKDKRAKAVTLTAAGHNRLKKAIPAISEVDKALLDLLPKNKRIAFQDTLRLIAETMSPEVVAEEDEPTGKKSRGKKDDKKKKKKKKKTKKQTES